MRSMPSGQRPGTHFERLARTIPRCALAHYPTPLVKADTLRKTIGGPELWFKRDDLISFGLGGNKIRALETIVADARNQHSDVLITGAGVQSNHVRATAAVAARFGLHCIALYWGEPPPQVDGNHRVTRMLGAEIRFTNDSERSSVDRLIDEVSREIVSSGKKPYPIPRGGACAIGALGHVLAVYELHRQCEAVGVRPQAIIMASGSGGTYAGWLLGIRLLNLPWQLICFSVSREPDELSRQVAQLATEAAALLELNWTFSAADSPIDDGFIGAGYGIPSPEGAQAIRTTARTEGLLLDPTYTGKAMAGYMEAVKTGTMENDDTVVFVHTGGEPAFFAGNGEWLNE